MDNSKALFHEFVNQITLDESQDEIKSMAYLVFESVFGISRTAILFEKSVLVSDQNKNRLAEIVTRLNKNEPLQYILNEALFYGRMFYVNSSVLIPLPETEELVREVIHSVRHISNPKILDIGSGSGCIAISLKLELPKSNVTALDVSDEALAVTSANAKSLSAEIEITKHNILTDELKIQDLDVIVSNPPYITLQEKSLMHNNVLHHEPHLALFVDDHDPLLFYKAIAMKATTALKPGGLLAFEINQQFGNEVADLFSMYGFTDIQIIKDLSGKDRIVKGILS